jgi:riboflavin kinase/FMN adenylyltransferase
LLHKLHDELKYDSLQALTVGIAKDCDDARAFFAARDATLQVPTP